MSIRVTKKTVQVITTADDQRTNKNRNRSLRRQMKRQIIADTLSDIEKVEKRMVITTDPVQLLALERLHDILYRSYCELIDSEV